MVGVDTLLHRLCFHPSFAEKAASKRAGFQNEGSAPGEGDDEPPDLALLEKVRAIRARESERVE